MHREKLKKLLGEGRVRQVIMQLLELAKTDSDLYNEVVQQSTFYTNFEKAQNAQSSSPDDLNKQLARINYALLNIIDRLPEKNYTKPILIGISILLLGGTGILGMQKGWFTEKNMTLAVYVHGKGDRTNKIMKEGEVCLFLQTKPECKSIDGYGYALFTQIPANFRDKKIRIEVRHPNQPFQVIDTKTEYLINDGEDIYVEVALKNNDKVYGRVEDLTGKYLENVRVSILNLETFTDKNGWFELPIPEDKQAPFHNITFEKKGFNNFTLKNYPVSSKRETPAVLEKSKQ